MFGIGIPELFVLGALLIIPIWTMVVAGRKGRNRFLWFFAGVFFNALALIAAYLSPPRAGTGIYVACPHCAETILAEAVKCKHCGSSLATPAARPAG
jgi:hypothetical protein